MSDLEQRLPPMASHRGVFADPAKRGVTLELSPEDSSYFVRVIDAQEGEIKSAYARGWHDGEQAGAKGVEELADRLRQYREALERIEQLTMSQFASVSDLANEAQDLARTTLKETTDV